MGESNRGFDWGSRLRYQRRIMQPTTIDLDADSRRALEFDQLLEQVARFAATPMGAATVRGLEPFRT